MRMRRLLLVVAGLELIALPARAQLRSPQDRQALLDYQLTLPRANHLIDAMGAMSRYVVSRPDFQQLLRKAATMTLAQQAAQMEHDPRAMAILKENGLTAAEYLPGVPALRLAFLAARGTGAPNAPVSPANLAFAKAHPELMQKLVAAENIRPPR